MEYRWKRILSRSTVKNLTEVDKKVLKAYAIWYGNTYTIKYEAGGGTGSMSDTTCTYGRDCTLAKNSFSRNGHSFKAWKINGNSYAESSKVKSLTTSGTIIATADWNAVKYEIKYDANGGKNAPSTQTKKYDEEIKLSSQEPTRSGWEFVGWHTTSDGHNAKYKPKDIYTSNKNITLYAVWKKTITITFKKNKAEWGNDQTKTCKYYQDESECEIKAPNIIKPEGKNKSGQEYSELFKYHGWNTKNNADNSNFNQGSVKKFSSNTTYYSVISFTKKNVIVKAYIGNGEDYVNVRAGNDFNEHPDGAWGGKWKLTGDWWYGKGAGGYKYWIKGNVVSGSSTCYLDGDIVVKEKKCSGWFTAAFAEW